MWKAELSREEAGGEGRCPCQEHTTQRFTKQILLELQKKKGHGLAVRPPHQAPSLGRRDPQPGDAPEGPKPWGYKGCVLVAKLAPEWPP